MQEVPKTGAPRGRTRIRKTGVDWDWLKDKALVYVPRVIVAAFVLKWVYGFLHDPLEFKDFLAFWVASAQGLAGKGAQIYDPANFFAALAAAAGQEFSTPWFYPPSFLLLILPLALLPYYLSLSMWVTVTLGSFLLVIRRLAPSRHTLWWALAFPGTLINLDYGQNGLLFAALLGGGLLMLERTPVCAGILLGLLSCKPNLALLIPVALVVGRYWRALGAALITAVVLALASGLALGWDAWGAFWHVYQVPIQAMEKGQVILAAMPTVAAMILKAGGGTRLAYLAQALIMLVTLVAVAWAWSREVPMALKVSVLTLSTLLFTAFAFEYELVRLAIPMAWLGWEGQRRGWRPGTKLFLVCGWLTPLFCRFLARMDTVQLTPLVLLLLLGLNIWWLRQAGVESSQ